MFNNLAIKPEDGRGEGLPGRRVDPGNQPVIAVRSQLLERINNGEHTFVGWVVLG
ncbi:hypothetical protein [Lyngbya sp. CCY1209]|uniref:hypothetical protein n=1 Tax=Lyngbya sp. CCY1209 TaxID=2886103 RepID=UPI002D214AD6|nr:hypothetical protein [Lyngbya sp. CCY1209]MEB3883560.1 hypothetical protein [Lyngbya sp. CCY1209]